MSRVTLLWIAVAAAAQTPEFRIGTKLVQVDVIVRNSHGPVTGLSREDFMVFDNGKPQQVSVFAMKSARKPEKPAAPLPPGAVSNRLNRDGEMPGRATVLLLDQVNTAPSDQAYARQKVVKFLEARSAKDQIGIYTLGLRLQAIQDLTFDQDRLNRAVARLKPQNANPRTFDKPGELEKRDPEMSGREAEEYASLENRERVMLTKKALKAIAKHLAKVPGRKNLIWITDSFPIRMPPNRYTPIPDDYSPDVKEAALALNDANVALYPIDARGLTFRYGLLAPGIDTMNLAAGLTGGQAYYADNGLDDLMREAVYDGEVTYTLGFYPSEETQNEQWHRLRVKVDRSGVSVRYRENYFASKMDGEAGRRPLEEVLQDPVDASEIGLLAETMPDQKEPERYQVTVTVDLHDIKLERQDSEWVGAIEVSFYIDGSGSARTLHKTIKIPEAELAANLEKGIVIHASIDPGKQSGIRVVTKDQATGATGSLTVPLKPR